MAHKLEYLLDFCNTDAQRRVVSMFIEGRTGPEIAQACGMEHRSGPDTMLRRIKKRAARSGQAPGHFEHGTAEGFRMGKVAGHVHTCTVGKQYVQVRQHRVLYYAHRIIWPMFHGDIPPGMQVDHIDGNGANNRLDNLRLVTASENKRNMRRMVTNTSGVTGVFGPTKKGLYIANGWINGGIVYIASSKDFDKVVRLRKAWERDNGFHENHGSERPL